MVVYRQCWEAKQLEQVIGLQHTIVTQAAGGIPQRKLMHIDPETLNP